MSAKPPRRYPVSVAGEKVTRPNYRRVFASMSDADIAADLENKRGSPGYRIALRAEVKRRAKGEQNGPR